MSFADSPIHRYNHQCPMTTANPNTNPSNHDHQHCPTRPTDPYCPNPSRTPRQRSHCHHCSKYYSHHGMHPHSDSPSIGHPCTLRLPAPHSLQPLCWVWFCRRHSFPRLHHVKPGPSQLVRGQCYDFLHFCLHMPFSFGRLFFF